VPVSTVLVVDDEPLVRDVVTRYLERDGHRVVTAEDGDGARRMIEAEEPSLVLLDVMLPGKTNGLDLCRWIRSCSELPVILLTARVEEADRIVGLELGADDYMTKPFSMRELAARVHVLLRRVERAALAASTPRSGILRLGELEIDHAQRRVRVRSEDVHLTPTEFDLLVCLANTPRAVLSREQLLAEVWDWADASGTRTVDSHIKALRRKIGAERIRTVHGVGYALETPTP
jgi:DNA-binding response OmpR family regulator